MKKTLFFAALVLLLLVCLTGCARNKKTSLVYVVDGETYHTDILENGDDFFDSIGMEPEKQGFLFGGWYYDEGTWENPLSYAELNLETEKKEYRVYAKWETVAFKLLKEERAYVVTGALTGAGDEIVIPEFYKDMPVVAIASGAFRDNKDLKSVKLPDTLEVIEEYAFAKCTALEKIVIPNSVTTVGRGAFSSCNSMTEVVFGLRVSKIQAEAFSHCPKLTAVKLPPSIKSIGSRAFAFSKALATVQIPFGLRSIGAGAFAGCAVTEITYTGTMEDFARITQEDFAKDSSVSGICCNNGVLPVAK